MIQASWTCVPTPPAQALLTSMDAGINMGDFDLSLNSVEISFATADIAALNVTKGLKFSSMITFLGKSIPMLNASILL